MSEEELLLGHVFFAPVGLNKDCLGHDISSDGLILGRAQGPVSLLFWAGPHKEYFGSFGKKKILNLISFPPVPPNFGRNKNLIF